MLLIIIQNIYLSLIMLNWLLMTIAHFLILIYSLLWWNYHVFAIFHSLLLGLLALLGRCYWTRRSNFVLVHGCATWSAFGFYGWLLLNIWDLMCCSHLEMLILYHLSHSIIILGSSSRLLLALNTIWSLNSNLIGASRSIQYLYRTISEWTKDRFWIWICLLVWFSSLTICNLSFSMCHIWKTVAISYHHTIIIAQHMCRMIYSWLLVLLILWSCFS